MAKTYDQLKASLRAYERANPIAYQETSGQPLEYTSGSVASNNDQIASGNQYAAWRKTLSPEDLASYDAGQHAAFAKGTARGKILFGLALGGMAGAGLLAPELAGGGAAEAAASGAGAAGVGAGAAGAGTLASTAAAGGGMDLFSSLLGSSSGLGGLLSLGGQLGGSYLASKGAKDAANIQSNAAAAAAAAARADRAPWTAAGTRALGTLEAGLAPGGQFNKPFTMADAQNMPAMQFALQQGNQAINNSAASRGGLLSTNNNQDLVKFAEGNAAQYENQAFNQWFAQQQKTLGATEGLAGIGQAMVNNNATDSSNAILASGGAQAAGKVSGANIWNSGISDVANQYQRLDMLGKIFGTQPQQPATSPSYASNYSSTDPASYFANNGSDVNTEVFSDVRLKKDISRVGFTDRGLPIYKYRMKDGGGLRMGVMAQEVEAVEPRAVRTHESGFKMVDYDKVQ